jgi:DNA primase
MPPGEDPDTLVKTGGAAALQPIIDDAMDLIERKIQLLEVKGWFEGVDHQREALDRLLPTIRAASDPIMRELYLTRVAERAGIPRSVLEQDLNRHGPAHAAPKPAVEARSPTRPNGGRALGPEARVLQTLLVKPDLIPQARAELAPELFERTVLRELFTALSKHSDAATQLPGDLSDAGQRVWVSLKQTAPVAVGVRPDDIYASSVQILLARPEYRKIHRLTDPGERRRLRAQLRDRYPEADRWYEWKRIRRRGEG